MPTNDPEYYQEWYRKNKLRVRKVRRAYYKRKKETLKAYQKEYRKGKRAKGRIKVSTDTSLAEIWEPMQGDVEV